MSERESSMEPMQTQLTSVQVRMAMRYVPTGAAPAVAPDVLAILERTVELDVIPRLLLSRRAEKPLVAQASIQPAQVDALVALLLERDEAVSASYVTELHGGGVAAEAIYLDLLAPAARRLGQMWVDDDCDFTDVTIGLFQLQHTLRLLGQAFGNATPLDANAPRVLLVPMPQEQHSFGLSMVCDFFRRAGWNAWSGPLESEGELAAMLGGAWFDVVGLSLICDEQLEGARRVIKLARRHSLNPDVSVMVGGPSFIDNPGLAGAIGADGTAIDGNRAVQQAASLVAAAAAARRQA